MPVIYDQAKPDVHEIAGDIIVKHHPELKMPDGEYVKLCILMASRDDDSEEPAVKHDGYPAAAIVSIIGYKQRVDKRADAEIVIDQKWWDDASDIQRRALLDHEINHIEIQTDNIGLVKTDDQGRPKLKMKLHDWQLGGFRIIAQRYGADAPEVAVARQFEAEYGDVAFQGEKLFG